MILPWIALAVSTVDSFPAAQALDAAINQAIAEDKLPGAVLLVGHDGKVVYHKAYGYRSLEPTVEAMTEDTIFDCASLTKVVATSSCMMRLLELGKYRLNDPVTQTIPEFQGGQSTATIRSLLTHFSGLKPDVPTSPAWSGYETGIQLGCTFPPQTVPNTEHIYSDINFELLGEIIRRVSGKPEDQFAREEVFGPLGMVDTTYNPPVSWYARIAPTERVSPDLAPLRGVVHDPTARYMGGVAGHAGVFSTAKDLARFCQMMLNEGEIDGKRVFSAATVRKFIEPQTPPDQPVLRGLGWDIDSPYSSNRGELFPIGSFGHTGFTGTSLWIDPTSKSYVVLLANAIHPHSRPPLIALRAKVATIVAAAVGITSRKVALTGYNDRLLNAGVVDEPARNAHTQTGLDVLETSGFAQLKGQKIGLVTNQTGVDRHGKRNLDLMLAAGVDVRSIFSPEHGFLGAEDREGIADTVDEKTHLVVHSLYGETTRPKDEWLADLDCLVFDIADVGVRFYTYETTLAYCLEAAAKNHKRVIVLDRPNPITGTRVEGPMLDAANCSFVGYLAGTPVRHGLTMGELATMFNEKLRANLDVVKMVDWQRGDWFESSGLPWINPSPNMRSLKAACLYPGICLVEFADISVGRGTDSPFEQIGADFVDGPALAETLNRRGIPGVRCYPVAFTPTVSRYANQTIQGVRFEITNRQLLDATRLGLEVACAIQRLYPGKVDWRQGAKLIGSDDVIRRIESGHDALTIQEQFQEEVRAFVKTRRKWLLYPE